MNATTARWWPTPVRKTRTPTATATPAKATRTATAWPTGRTTADCANPNQADSDGDVRATPAMSGNPVRRPERRGCSVACADLGRPAVLIEPVVGLVNVAVGLQTEIALQPQGPTSRLRQGYAGAAPCGEAGFGHPQAWKTRLAPRPAATKHVLDSTAGSLKVVHRRLSSLRRVG